MDIIVEWKKEERRKRPMLSNSLWENVILCIGSEGYSVKTTHEILTLGRAADQGIRDMWGLGPGKAPKWTADEEERAYNVIWNFFKRDIEDLYYGKIDSDGKVLVKGQSTVNIQRIILENTGFKLPSQSMKNHMEEVWGFSMRKRPYKAKSESPSTPSVEIESPNATVLSDGQRFQDLRDHRVKRDIRAESATRSTLLSKSDGYQYDSSDVRFQRLEDQVMILTEDFKAALEIGKNQSMTLKSFEKQFQKLNDEIVLLRSENSKLAMQNTELRTKNRLLEAQVDELRGFNQSLEACMFELQTKTLTLQEEVGSLDALKLENKSLHTQNSILLQEHALLQHILCQLVTRIQQLPSSSEHVLRTEVEKLGKMYDRQKLKDDSPRDSLDSAYYSNILDFDTQQLFNMVPVRFQNTVKAQAGEMRSCLESNAQTRRHCKIAPGNIPMKVSDSDNLHERDRQLGMPSLTASELADQTSRQIVHSYSAVEMQLSGTEDILMQDCILPAGPVFKSADAGFGDLWNDSIMFNPPQQIPDFSRYGQIDDQETVTQT